MSAVVLDTDVASAVLKQRLPTYLARQLTGRQLAITFVTVGELTKWTLVRRWGPQRMTGLHRFFNQVVVLPYSPTVGRVWGELQAYAQLRGRPRPANDTWIAACCIARDVPLATSTSRTSPTDPRPRPARHRRHCGGTRTTSGSCSATA